MSCATFSAWFTGSWVKAFQIHCMQLFGGYIYKTESIILCPNIKSCQLGRKSGQPMISVRMGRAEWFQMSFHSEVGRWMAGSVHEPPLHECARKWMNAWVRFHITLCTTRLQQPAIPTNKQKLDHKYHLWKQTGRHIMTGERWPLVMSCSSFITLEPYALQHRRLAAVHGDTGGLPCASVWPVCDGSC